jgi:uncharacterized SAM-binding protein YcdF (DUF218 family)
VYGFLVSLIQPYFLLLVLIGVSLWRLTRAAKPGWRWGLLLWSPYVLLLVLSCPLTAHLALGSLEWWNPPVDRRPEDVEAIVVLSAGFLAKDEVRAQSELDLAGRVRTETAARYYHQGPPVPILVSGGAVNPQIDPEPVADLMRDFLLRLGVPREQILVERTSKTTYENASESARMLKERGISRILLVTGASHLPRAAACFRKQGLDVVPAGCYYQSTGWHLSWYHLQPAVEPLSQFHEAVHEWLGLVWYRLVGRI